MNAAPPFSAESKTIDGIPVLVLRDGAGETEALIAPTVGFNSYEMKVRRKRVFWSPYASAGEMAARPAMLGNPLLWPWANRIDGVAYFFGGRKYLLNTEIGNVSPGPNRTPIHGLLRFDKRWKVVGIGAGQDGAWVRGRLEFYRFPELMEQFPFAHVIEITYRLSRAALEVETAIENTGAEPMPVSLGFHPYFQVNDAPRDAWKVRLAARLRYKLSDRLIPTGETEPNPYPSPVTLAGVSLDDVFGDLIRDADGFARFSVEGAKERVTVEYGRGFEVAVVYAPPGRGFICFEPMSAITNAFNAAHDGWYKGLPEVPPGETWRASFRVRADGF
jgi:aldose 1-epimerase